VSGLVSFATGAPTASELQEATMRLGSIVSCQYTRGVPALVCLALLVAACALPRTETATIPRPEEIPALRRALAKNGSDVATRVRLAEALRRAKQPDSAARLLEPMTTTTPVAAFYLGLVREDQGRPGDARQLYQRYLSGARTPELRDQVRDRLALLDRMELDLAVKDALSQEDRLRSRTPEPRTVGVFPFLTVTNDPQLRSLGTALAELLTTDLAQTDRIKVVERVRLQDLLNEIKLSEARRVEPATAVRSGRLLGAGTLIQGRIEGTRTELSLQTAVVRVATPNAAPNPLRDKEALNRFFDAEKRLALAIYDRMGVQLTSAERGRVTQQATSNVQALLELGFGLEAQDAGRYAEAAARFERAAQLDPNFALAKQRATEARAQSRAVAVSTTTLSQTALSEIPALRPVNLFQAVQGLVPNPGVRDAAVEAFGTEGVSRHGTVEIVIRRPGGTE
jgi:tetratricopeptide (TPR) repeat protein